MIRKFECRDCGTKFSSEEKMQVKCPRCGSDNVDYARIHIPYKYIGIAICAIIAVIMLLKIDYSSIISSFFPNEDIENEDTTISDVSGEEYVVQKGLVEEIEGLGIIIPPTIKGVKRMELDADGNYNVVVKIENAPGKGYSVQISDVKTGKVVAKSDNGEFKGVPFSQNDGKYYAQIVNASTNEALSEQTVITGFIENKPISKKLSKSELQDLINRQDPSLKGHDNEYLSPVYKIKYTGLPKGSEYAPDNLSDVYEMFEMGAWTSVEVISLDYDNSNHISSITLKVNAPIRPDFDN